MRLTDKIEVFNEDCMETMSRYPDNHFDVVITDPPYGIDFQSSRRIESQRFKRIKNDSEPYTEWLKPLFQKMKDGGRLICFYRWDVQDHFLDAIEDAGFQCKSQIVWDKGGPGLGDLNGAFAPAHELAIYATKGRYVFNNGRPKSMFKVNKVDPNKMIHPNEKPIALMRRLIRYLVDPGDQVFEPFGGSFSFGLAAHLEGLSLVASELDPDYFNAMVKRFKEQTAQKRMFA